MLTNVNANFATSLKNSTLTIHAPAVVQYMYNSCTILVQLVNVQILYKYCTYIVQRPELVPSKYGFWAGKKLIYVVASLRDAD